MYCTEVNILPPVGQLGCIVIIYRKTFMTENNVLLVGSNILPCVYFVYNTLLPQ